MSAAAIARRGLALVLFLGALGLMVHLILDLNRVKVQKTDLGELNHVRYGLLDADQWVSRVAAVLERRINEFELTEANRPRIKRAVEQILDSLLVGVERSIRRHNLQGGGTLADQLRGLLQQGLQDLLVDFDALRRKVPEYAERVLEELAKPESKRELKAQLLAFLQSAANSTFSRTDRSAFQGLLAHYDCADAAACTDLLRARIGAARLPILQQTFGVFVLIGLLFALCLGPDRVRPGAGARAPPGLDEFRLFLLTGATLILLAGGILSPMIEIEARIAELTLLLLGEPITFTDQVLYFQTKSVFDVVSILVQTGAADMLLVAVLIVAFSVIFPALKVIATFLYYYDVRGLRGAASVRFFALKSSKWSMADVFVIAIFMSYIGFSGLMGSQLGALGQASPAAQVLTTNGTALAPGFYLFLGFVLASLALSTAIEHRVGERHAT